MYYMHNRYRRTSIIQDNSGKGGGRVDKMKITINRDFNSFILMNFIIAQ